MFCSFIQWLDQMDCHIDIIRYHTTIVILLHTHHRRLSCLQNVAVEVWSCIQCIWDHQMWKNNQANCKWYQDYINIYIYMISWMPVWWLQIFLLSSAYLNWVRDRWLFPIHKKQHSQFEFFLVTYCSYYTHHTRFRYRQIVVSHLFWWSAKNSYTNLNIVLL